MSGSWKMTSTSTRCCTWSTRPTEKQCRSRRLVLTVELRRKVKLSRTHLGRICAEKLDGAQSRYVLPGCRVPVLGGSWVGGEFAFSPRDLLERRKGSRVSRCISRGPRGTRRARP